MKISKNSDLIIDIQLFPCFLYCKMLIQYQHIVFEQYENFQKMSFRNRYMVSGANGVINLSVPVVGGREQKSLIREIAIDYSTDWQTRHWRSIISSYSKAPFFEFYRNDIHNLLFSNEKFLFNYNLKIFTWLFKILKINGSVSFTEIFKVEYLEEEDFRNKILPKNYLDSQGSRSPFYAQVFEDRHGFRPNLSILDLIFCEGPNARFLLEESVK